MTNPDTQARNRYFLIAGTHALTAAGAVFGVVLAARAVRWEQTALGIAIVITGLYCMAVVPKALAHRWRTPPQP
jgi:hypothetical protein